MQARHGSHGDYPIVVLAPASVKDMYYLTVKAFKIAFRFSTPVIVLSDEIVGHMRESVTLPPLGETESYERRAKNLIDGRRRHRTGLVHTEKGLPTTDLEEYERLLKRLFAKFDDFEPMVRFEGDEGREVLFVAYGSSYRLAKSTAKLLTERGVSAGVLKLESIFPFPEDIVRKYSRKAELVVVPEMNAGQIVREVERVCCCRVKRVSYFGSLILPEKLAEIVEVEL